MKKKTWYWSLAVAGAVIVIAIVLLATSRGSSRTPGTQPGAANSGQMDQGGMDHGAMDHGPSDRPADAGLSGYLDEQDTIMSTMIAGMEGIEHSGNAAIDFLSGMIPHHEAAVAMAERYLQYGGEHTVLSALAQDIITAQTEEIEQMKGMIEDLEANAAADEAQAKAYLNAYDKLMEHSMSHAAADSLDAAFADGMIMHHQMAVDMANAVLPYTDEAEVKELAQAIVDTQKHEISSMQAVLDDLQK